MPISTKPKNEREAAALARARQLTHFRWTPLRDVPTFTKEAGKTVLPAGVEVLGFPYSSTERQDKFFAENISFETFLTAIPNENSKLYQPGHGQFGSANYGVVCNGFVRYAFGIPYRVNTKNWFKLPGMRLIAERDQFTVNDIELLDVLHAFGYGRNHVALVTDILRDEESGEIVEVEVSEAVRPSCLCARYTPEKLFERFQVFSLCRYDNMDEVPLFDEEEDKLLHSGIEKVSPKIALDAGNKANYLLGEEVLVTINVEESDTVELLCEGKLIESIQVDKRAQFPLSLGRGYYEARLQKAGEGVEFAVNAACVKHTAENGMLTVEADPCDENSEIVYADLRLEGDGVAGISAFLPLTDEERESGRFSREIPEDAVNFKVYYKNKYGVWTHPMKAIF